MSAISKGVPRLENQLPVGWKLTKLGDVIAEARAGFACGLRDDAGTIQLRMNNVDTRGNFVWDEFIRVPASTVQVAKYRLLPCDVLFNNTNSTELVGKTAFFTGHPEPVVYSNHFTRIRTQKDKLDPAYLSFWLNGEWRRGTFARICNRWIGQSAVKANKLFPLSIPLPPLAEQKRIAGIVREQLAAVERARMAAEARLEAIKALSAAFLRNVFPQTGKPLPNGWRWVKLGDISDGPGQYGTSTKSNGEKRGLPVLGMYHIHEGNIRWENLSYVDLEPDKMARYILHEGDLLFNRTNSAELVGKTAVYDRDTPAVFASYLIRFRVLAGTTAPYFVSTYINSHEGRSFIEKNMARAIGQVNISASTMRAMPIPLPLLPVQKDIVRILKERMTVTEKARAAAEEELATTNALPAAILRRAFSGGI